MTRSIELGAGRASYLGYLGDVAAALGGLPAADRDELLETVVDHLESIAAESGSGLDRAALVQRLGAPAGYAAELASAAGLQLGTARREPTSFSSVVTAAREWSGTRATTAYLARLVPAWWTVRAFLIGGLLIALVVPISGYSYTGNSWETHVNLLRHWNPDVGGFYGGAARWVVGPLLALAVGSVALGLRAENGAPAARVWNRVADVAGVVSLLLVPTWWISPMFYAYVVSR